MSESRKIARRTLFPVVVGVAVAAAAPQRETAPAITADSNRSNRQASGELASFQIPRETEPAFRFEA